MDCFQSPAKIDHITAFTELPLPTELQRSFDTLEMDEPIPLNLLQQVQRLLKPDDDLQFPPYLVINFMFPNYSPSLMNSTLDGHGFMLVIYYVLYGTQRRKILQMIQDGEPSALLLQNFGQANLISTKHSLKGRLKGIPKVLNIKDFDMGLMVNNILAKYNATPFLTGPIHQRWYSGQNYLEVDVDVHEYCYMARKVAYACIGYFPMMKIHMAFTIEGRDDDELPERVLGATYVSLVDIFSSPSITKLHPMNRSICADGEKILQQCISHRIS
uniref:DNA ligase n=1 Tax=Lygus hesperus TaxID=30085 RepID=A0A0A9YBJ7_LYGHE